MANGLSLQQFISDSLVQIVGGVKDAQAKVKDSGARISPADFEPTASGLIHMGGFRRDFGQLVEFDIAVTARESDKAEAGIGVFVVPITIGARGAETTETANVSRIRFNVPLFLPQA